MYFTFLHKPFALPQFEVIVDESLGFVCGIYGLPLPDDHEFYKIHKRSLRNITISELLDELLNQKLCPGVSVKSEEAICHFIPCELEFNETSDHVVEPKHYYRSKECMLLTSTGETCACCESFIKKHSKAQTFKQHKINTPAHLNAPLSQTHPNCVKLALQQERLRTAELQKKINKMENEIKVAGVEIDDELCSGLFAIMADNEQKVSPFMKLFWEQQTKLFNMGHKRYHPMIIRFCLSLASKSPSAYNELRNSNILTLPGCRTLRNYKNAIKPKAGFNPAVIAELCETASRLKGAQRYVVLSIDEVKIQENLVYDKHAGHLIGFVDLGDAEIDYACFNEVKQLASHALVYHIRGLASDLKFSLAYFGTKGVTSYQIMTTFWEAIAILELTCQLPVIATVSDGASSNRKFYRMHQLLAGKENDVTHRTVNLFAPERYIWFFADAPHLMKTTRNCIFHSGGGKGTRSLWNNGKQIIWDHFVKIVQDEMKCGLKIAPRLSQEHVQLTPFSCMNVRLAVQLLSGTVSKILKEYYPESMHATSELCGNMDRFFDILNSRNRKEGVFKRNVFLLPFQTETDERFDWLESHFLQYFEQWKHSIASREGDFSKEDRDRMFLSAQTYEGLKITVYSVIEATKFLLQNGMQYVLTEKFNQDCLEEHFGRQRSLGRRSDNPSLYQFGYNENTLRMQRSVVCSTGNTEGANKYKRKHSWYTVDNTPLKQKSNKNCV